MNFEHLRPEILALFRGEVAGMAKSPASFPPYTLDKLLMSLTITMRDVS